MNLNITAIRSNNIAFRGNDSDNNNNKVIAENAAGCGGALLAKRTLAGGTKVAKIIEKTNDAVKTGTRALTKTKRGAKAIKLSLLQRAASFAGKMGLTKVSNFIKGPMAAKISGVLGGVLAAGVLVKDLASAVSAATGVVDAQS